MHPHAPGVLPLPHRPRSERGAQSNRIVNGRQQVAALRLTSVPLAEPSYLFPGFQQNQFASIHSCWIGRFYSTLHIFRWRNRFSSPNMKG